MDGPMAGIALWCQLDGTVEQIVRDEYHLSDRIHIGDPVSILMHETSREKFGHFLSEIVSKRAAHNWEFDVLVREGAWKMQFSGACAGDKLLLIAARNHDTLGRFGDDLMRINNEQANALRSASKALALRAQPAEQHDEAVLEDLTRVNNELANLQREMAGKNVELGRMNDQKNRFLGMAAHDLRSPIGVIQSYSEFLEDEAALNAEQLEFLSTIKETSEFMLQVIDDLLDVSQIEAGKLSLVRQSVDLVALLQRNVALNRVLAARKSIELKFSPSVQSIVLALDARKIEQVLNNLIGNAVKFSNRGTVVEVRVDRTDAGVTVAVQDQGQGIPKSELPKLFKPFSTASVRGTAGEKSTGLGLAISHRIVEGHGGRLEVESEPGKGSTFSVILQMEK